jgi:hypothetical protein
MTKTATRIPMPKTLSPKQIDARKFWRLADSTDEGRDALRQRLAEDVAAWEAAGNKVTEVPIGVSGIKSGVFASYAKAQASGLKKLNAVKKEESEGE